MAAATVAGLGGAATTPAEAETLSAPASAVSGMELSIAGKTVRLSHIRTVMPGTPCEVRGRSRDCGQMARAGLQELVTAARVVCRSGDQRHYRCTAGGYDLAYGLIHSGWAVALPGAPAAYLAKMDEARARGRGLWQARLAGDRGRTYADHLLTR